MFREMRRKQQMLSEEECIQILKDGTSGVLALSGDDGYPYAVPISYVYDNRKLYFHSAKVGHKVDAVKSCDKASFCVTAQDIVMPAEYTSYFKSVIVFGKIRIVEDETEMLKGIEKLALKYNPSDSEENRRMTITQAKAAMCIIELSAEHITGKEAKELVVKNK